MAALRRPHALEICQNAKKIFGSKSSVSLTIVSWVLSMNLFQSDSCPDVIKQFCLNPFVSMLTREDFVQSNNKYVCLENAKFQTRSNFRAIYGIFCYNMIYGLVQVLDFKTLHIYFVCSAIDQMIESSKFG